MPRTGYLARYRYPVVVIRTAVFLHILMPSRVVPLCLFFLFRARVSHKTVCDWSKKFRNDFDLPSHSYRDDMMLVCHADEKYVNVARKWHYLWTLKDHLGNIIKWLLTAARDLPSAKKLMKEGHKKIGRDVDILVRDGLPAYDRATKYLGLRCRSIVAGISGKDVLHKKRYYHLTNNPSESLNSEIDAYLARFQYNFSSLESAQRYIDGFMLTKFLKKSFAEKRFSEASSMLCQAMSI